MLYKSIFIIVLVSMGLIFSFITACKKGDDKDKLTFTILLLSALFFGSAAVGLGGAGYIERLPAITMPLIVYAIFRFASFIKPMQFKLSSKLITHKNVSTLLLFVILVPTVFIGAVFHVAGRNFQSIPYGEYKLDSFN